MRFLLNFSEDYSLNVILKSHNPLQLELNGKVKQFDIVQFSDHLYSIISGGSSYLMTKEKTIDGFRLCTNGKTLNAAFRTELEILLDEYGFADTHEENAGEIHAAIPGLISKIFVKVGENLTKGDQIYILEAMKMENELTAPISGTIKTIYVKEGATVEKGDLIMVICPND